MSGISTLDSMVETFKSYTSHAQLAPRGKKWWAILLYQVPGEGLREVFTARRINRWILRHDSSNDVSQRMVITMAAMQDGYHNGGRYPGKMGEYKNAKPEFRRKYRLLVNAFSEAAISKIETMDLSTFSRSIDPHLAADFCARLRQDQLEVPFGKLQVRVRSEPRIQPYPFDEPPFSMD